MKNLRKIAMVWSLRRTIMLEKVRKPGRAKNFLAYVIFGAICLTFVFMGDIPGGGGLTTGGPVAIVNKEPISFADYREAYTRLQNQYKGQFDKLPAPMRQAQMKQLRENALEMLINSQIVSQAAMGLGLYSSDEEVRDFIIDIPAFKEDDRFRRERYDNYLSYRRISAEKFEEEIRKDVANTQVRKLLEMSLAPSKISEELNEKMEAYKMNLDFVRFSDYQIKNAIKPSGDEITQFVADSENETALSDYFTANKDQYQEEEKVKARHILVKFDESKPGDVDRALKKIQEIKKKTESEDFAKLAKENSDDPGSKAKGGDLGFFGRGRMVPEFEKVAFSAELNKVSDPVKSQFGYHIIKVEDKKEAVSKTLDDVKNEVATELIKEEKFKSEKERIETWLKEAQEKELKAWLGDQKLKWEESGEFKLNSRYLPKLSALEEEDINKFLVAAKEQKKWVPEIIVANGQNYILKVKDFKEEAAKVDEKKAPITFNPRKNQIVSDVFKTWLDQRKEASLIERNPSVIQ